MGTGSRDLTYEEGMEEWVQIGTRHASSRWHEFIVRSLLTGFYLNCSFSLGVRAKVESGGQAILFGIFLSFGLVFITLTNSFLFTQDIATVTLSCILRRTSFAKGVKSLLLTYTFNYAGAVAGAFFFGYACDFFIDPEDPVRKEILLLGSEKTSLAWSALISRAMCCNWMVCLANFLQARTSSVASKVLLISLPISTFASLGLEHSIVNMSILTMCLFLDPHCFPVKDYFKNIGLSTLGNCLGAILFMVLPSYYTLSIRRELRAPANTEPGTDLGDHLNVPDEF